MDSTSKPFYKSRTLWGILLTLAAHLAIGLADADVFPMSQALRAQLTGLSLVGLGLAGYGRMSARSSLHVRGGK